MISWPSRIHVQGSYVGFPPGPTETLRGRLFDPQAVNLSGFQETFHLTLPFQNVIEIGSLAVE